MKLRPTSEFRDLSVEDTLRLLEAHENGLTDSEALDRIKLFGPNEVTEREKSFLIRFALRLWGPMPWLLELAAILSLLLGHLLEAIIIVALLGTNALIGFLNERSSRQALALLKQKLALKAKVLRDGKWETREVKNIVPGDIIGLGLGDVVPADAKTINDWLSVDQALLTGESLPVEVGPAGLIYAGSMVKRGESRGVVVGTGKNTSFGKTVEMVKVASPKSHQQEIMLAIVRYMLLLGAAALVLVLIHALKTKASPLTLVTFAVVFLMGAVPVALPAVLTIVQAAGARELARKKVLVTRLDSIEDAASVDILCLDKTGTITQNDLAVVEVIPAQGYSPKDALITAGLCSREAGGDAIDLAVLKFIKTSGIDLGSYKRVSFAPFDPSSKRAEAIIEANGRRIRAVKGAPQVIMTLCSDLTDKIQGQADKKIEELSQKGYRSLALAISGADDRDHLQFVGLLALSDPPRPDSKSLIGEIKREGIKLIMLTGDNMAIAKEIARQVSLGDKIIRQTDLGGHGQAEQARMIEECDGLAEIYPEDKYKTVKLLQSRGHMVGMTGDGVNDAPALKQAEMGIAVSRATDVAKASAGIVLVEPGLPVIADAVKTSRQIYQRMLTWVLNKITKTIQIVGLLVIGFFWLDEVVISLLGMSLLVFSNDFVTMSLATDRVESTNNPNKWNIRNIVLACLVLGLFFVAEGGLALFIGLKYFHFELVRLRSFVLLVLVFTSQLRVFIVRERRHFWSSRPGRAMVLSSAATLIAFGLIASQGIIIPSLAWNQILAALTLSALFVFSLDFPKYYIFKKCGL